MANMSEKTVSRPLYYLGMLGVATAFVSGCSSNDGTQATQGTQDKSKVPGETISSSPQNNTLSITTNSSPSVVLSNANTATPAFTQPLVQGKNNESVQVIAGLIPPTETDNYVRNISKGRTDPFGTLSVQPIVNRIPSNNPSQASGRKTTTVVQDPTNAPEITAKSPLRPEHVSKKPVNLPGGTLKQPSSSETVKVAAKPIPGGTLVAPKPIHGRTTSPSTASSTLVAARSNPPIVPVSAKAPSGEISTGVIKPIPPAPTPTLAPNIMVTGLVEMDGKTQVLLRLPNETESRYVEVGSTILNGKVKIKRVDNDSFVVFEESGVEVSRKIGDKVLVANK